MLRHTNVTKTSATHQQQGEQLYAGFDAAANNRRFLVMGLLSVPHEGIVDDDLYMLAGIERDPAPNNFCEGSIDMDVGKSFAKLKKHFENQYKAIQNAYVSAGPLTYTVLNKKRLNLISVKERNDNLHPAVPTFSPTTNKEFQELLPVIYQLPFARIKNVRECSGMDYEQFNVERLCGIAGEREIEVLQQLNQRTCDSWNFFDNKDRVTFAPMSRIPSNQFAKVYTKQIEFFKRGWKKLKTSFSLNTLEELEMEMVALQLKPDHEIEKFQTETHCVLSTFGTNFDLDEENFPDAYAEVIKLAEEVHPIHDNSLLNFIDLIIPGINQPQTYFKAPGCRTSAHIETVSLYSVNINCGPGRCFWFGVPSEYAGAMEDYVREELGMNENESVYGIKFWPDLEKLREKKIPVFSFVQEANEMVFVGLQAWHWVQTESYTTNVSWNIAPKTEQQFDAILELCDHALIRRAERFFPVKTLVQNLLNDWKSSPQPVSSFSKAVVRTAERILKHEAYIAKLIEKKGETIEQWKESTVEMCFACDEELLGCFVRGKNDKMEEVSACYNCRFSVQDPTYFAINSTLAADLAALKDLENNN